MPISLISLDRKSGHESDGSFSYLDLEESHAKGMIAFEKVGGRRRSSRPFTVS